jgi:hypothetical protein
VRSPTRTPIATPTLVGPGATPARDVTDLTALGTIIARVTSPLGGGRNIEVIRDGDKPPVGNVDSARQYDTYDGVNAADEDWIGYAYATPKTFMRVVFQEGKHFVDGGWFETLTVQVRHGGVWSDVSGLTITPSYAGNNGIGFETYLLDFAPTVGEAIRIVGAPGGSADFISIGELEVFGSLVLPTPTPTPTPTRTATATPTPTPTRTATPLGTDLTHAGTIIARVTNPQGGGRNLEVIRDGDKPPVGSTAVERQYDSFDGPDSADEDWIGYAYATPQTFGKVVFQEGMHFVDGGWFDTLTVQVRQADAWVAVAGLTVTPQYPGNDGVSYETFVLAFAPITGDAIRIYGAPGGRNDFISVGELEVFAASDSLPVVEASDVSESGTIIALVTQPLGSGARGVEVIRDGNTPPAGSTDSSRQYDTWNGPAPAAQDWIGYAYPSPLTFVRLVFQEGREFWDGGWFDSLGVQVRQGGVWVDVDGLAIDPPYPGANGIGYETFTLDFVPTPGDAIRLIGAPGGSAGFISVGELRAYAYP